MNEGFLGKYTFGGERAATDDHPTVIHYLPLAASVSEKLDVGLLLKAVDVYGATAVVGAENTGVTAASVTLDDARRDNSPGSGAISSSKSLLHICQQNYKKAKGEGNPSPFLFTVYSVSFSRSASMAVSLPRLIS